MDNAADFYTDRVSKKDRKQTMVDELLADAEFKKFQKRKYVEIIEDKSKKQGKKFFKKKKKTWTLTDFYLFFEIAEYHR